MSELTAALAEAKLSVELGEQRSQQLAEARRELGKQEEVCEAQHPAPLPLAQV